MSNFVSFLGRRRPGLLLLFGGTNILLHRCDVIDTLVEMELVIGCLVDLVTWFSLMEYCTRGIGWGSCSNLVM